MNMSKTKVDYSLISKWCISDQTCTRASTAADLANRLLKLNFPKDLARLSERRTKIEKIVFDSAQNDLIYEPKGLKVLLIEALCNDRGSFHGILAILSPDKEWMKSVYGSCGLLAHLKHFKKVL